MCVKYKHDKYDKSHTLLCYLKKIYILSFEIFAFHFTDYINV